jgi:hypothetical protein
MGILFLRMPHHPLNPGDAPWSCVVYIPACCAVARNGNLRATRDSTMCWCISRSRRKYNLSSSRPWTAMPFETSKKILGTGYSTPKLPPA